MQKKRRSLHPRNIHNDSYDLELLCHSVPELKAHLISTPDGRQSVNFSDQDAVKKLNQALLKTAYGIEIWDIPPGYLCPPVPGRVDYLHYIADLLAAENSGEIPTGRAIRALDIGTGANCIYPIVGNRSYGWQFVGSDIDKVSLDTAKQIVKFNPNLKGKVDCRHQPKPEQIFNGIIRSEEHFDLTLCNPPFHASASEAQSGTQRKLRNLAKGKKGIGKPKGTLNFGGQSNELWCPGGEFAFIRQMIRESVEFSGQCLWFTSLVSRHENLSGLQKVLKKYHANKVQVIEMQQGNKLTRILAWTFQNKKQRAEWREHYWAATNK